MKNIVVASSLLYIARDYQVEVKESYSAPVSD